MASGATLCCGAQASQCGGFSCCRAGALGARASVVVAHELSCSRHVGSSQTKARTRVPCIGRQILNHCATREVPSPFFLRQQNWRRLKTLVLYSSAVPTVANREGDRAACTEPSFPPPATSHRVREGNVGQWGENILKSKQIFTILFYYFLI